MLTFPTKTNFLTVLFVENNTSRRKPTRRTKLSHFSICGSSSFFV